jgi:hypothetical protein
MREIGESMSGRCEVKEDPTRKSPVFFMKV